MAEIPDDLTTGPTGEQGKAWAFLYELYGELPIPEREGWKIAAMYLRLEAENTRLKAEVTIPELKKHGVQGLAAVTFVRAMNALLASRASKDRA